MLENLLLHVNDCFDTTIRTNAYTLVMENSETRSYSLTLILWSYSLTKPHFSSFYVFFQACSLQNEVGDPPFIYIYNITNSSSYSGKSLRSIKKINGGKLSRGRPWSASNPKYYICKNVNLKLFQKRLNIFSQHLKFFRATVQPEIRYALSHDRAGEGHGSIPDLTSQTVLNACSQRVNAM